jgi:hypothetical protein
VTLFEYLSVAVSIVLSLSVSHILLNLRAVFSPERRYWVHAVWVVVALFTHVLLWWGFWSYRQVESWNLATFAILLLNPGILFVGSAALVLENPDRSWDAHFFRVRRSFFAAFACIPAVSLVRDQVLFDVPIVTLTHAPELSMTAISLAAWALETRRAHAVLAATALLTIFAGAVSIWLAPGASRAFVP